MIAWSRSSAGPAPCGISAVFRRKSFDGSGNYSLGVKEQDYLFPEINYDQIDAIDGNGYCDYGTFGQDGE